MNEELLRRSYERLLVVRENDGPDREECPSVEMIHGLIQRRGDEAERLKRLDHVMQCPHCQKEFNLLRTVELARPPAPVMAWHWWALAAGLVLVVSAGAIWQVFRPQPEVFRGGGEEVVLVSPREGAQVSAPVRFVWRSVPGAVNYRLEMVDDQDRVVSLALGADTAQVVPQLPQGSNQRWRVLAEFLRDPPIESDARELLITPAAPRE